MLYSRPRPNYNQFNTIRLEGVNIINCIVSGFYFTAIVLYIVRINLLSSRLKPYSTVNQSIIEMVQMSSLIKKQIL